MASHAVTSNARGHLHQVCCDCMFGTPLPQAIVDFVKKSGGRVNASKIGAAVKRPAGVAEKLTAFLANKKDTFVVLDKGDVELKK